MIRSVLLDFASGLGELLLPRRCAACEEIVVGPEPFCDVCALSVEAVDDPCPRCALPLPPPAPGMPPSVCLGCQFAPPPWTAARAPLAYAGSLAVAVRRWKLGEDDALTEPLARLLAPALARLGSSSDAVMVPVPLHPRRLRSRGFNQASLLARTARSLARSHVPVAEWLDRVVDTPAQAGLDAVSRRKSVRRAFAGAARAPIRDRHIIVVDDVLTTGATADACTRALLDRGAARVDVLTLARTLP